MALRNKYIAENGSEKTLYYRVVEINSHYEKIKGELASKTVNFNIEAIDETDNSIVYESKETRDANQLFWHDIQAQDQEVEVLIDKAYEYLKTLEHFSKAEDC